MVPLNLSWVRDSAHQQCPRSSHATVACTPNASSFRLWVHPPCLCNVRLSLAVRFPTLYGSENSDPMFALPQVDLKQLQSLQQFAQDILNKSKEYLNSKQVCFTNVFAFLSVVLRRHLWVLYLKPVSECTLLFSSLHWSFHSCTFLVAVCTLWNICCWNQLGSLQKHSIFVCARAWGCTPGNSASNQKEWDRCYHYGVKG